MGLEAVDQLATRIERRWREVELDPRQFSDVARSSLAEADLAHRITPDEIVDWVLNASTLPQQQGLPAAFGQPPVTLFRSRRFYVEALFWLDGTTSIHQHSFSGAFQVLAGSSIETRYSFSPDRAFDGRVVVGRLRVLETALLRRGDIRPIASGPQGLIHSLFHLERPSVTIVVRTFNDPTSGPQFSYSHPGVGHDPFYKEETLDRSLEVVGMLRQLGAADFEERVGALIARSDVHAAFRILGECASIADHRLFDRLVGRLRDAQLAGLFRETFQETRRISFLRGRRRAVTDPTLRFFLGILLNARRREDVLALARAHSPDVAPERAIAAWMRQLAQLNLSLQAGGLPWQPNMFGLPEMTDALEEALAESVAGREPTLDPDGARFLEAVRSLPSFAALFA